MKNLLYCLTITCMLGACAKDNTSKPSRFDGPDVSIGNGKANAWLTEDAQGNATALGFTLRKGALDQLPAAMPGSMFMLALPDEALRATPFNHIMINWNPHGHEPVGIYDLPHFDFHFYMVPMSDVMQIPPYPQNPAAFDHVPSAVYLPAGYVKSPGGVPGMGAHWSDVASPEFHGQRFTETLIYGSYDGHVTFMEPMVALSVLQNSPAVEQDIKQPAQYEKPGYYPTHYRITAQPDGSDEVVLTQFVKR